MEISLIGWREAMTGEEEGPQTLHEFKIKSGERATQVLRQVDSLCPTVPIPDLFSMDFRLRFPHNQKLSWKTAFSQSDLWFLLIKARLRGLIESLLAQWLITLHCFQL